VNDQWSENIHRAKCEVEGVVSFIRTTSPTRQASRAFRIGSRYYEPSMARTYTAPVAGCTIVNGVRVCR
jgi:hypothetical protein